MYVAKDLTEEVNEADKKCEYGNTDACDQLILSITGTTFNLIMEAEGNVHKSWIMLLKKYEVSDEKQESLTDVTMEWSAY